MLYTLAVFLVTSSNQCDLISFHLNARSKVLPIEDDLVFRIGHRGRSKGQFTNPQVLFEL